MKERFLLNCDVYICIFHEKFMSFIFNFDPVQLDF